jgi:NTE family protein
VSGGSVIGALYVYSEDSFEEFDNRICDLLDSGLMSGIVRRTLHPKNLLKSVLTSTTAGVAAKAAQGLSLAGKALQALRDAIPGVMRRRSTTSDWSENLVPPVQRWWSRSQAFEEVLRKKLFGETMMASTRREEMDIVINATELRTATAFRYGSRLSSSSRYGRVKENQCSVAEAVAASAAYPLFLPAFHRTYQFREEGIEETEVVLTDGGAYDNLGTTCLAPDRNPRYTDHVYDHDSVVASHAGMGQWSRRGRPYGLVSRMRRSLATTFRKNEDAQKGEVIEWAMDDDSGLRNAVLTSLGQKDERLRRDLEDRVPDDLVPRKEVIHYPTDFRPMPTVDRKRIAKRGEQITKLLVESYWS